MQVGLKWLRDYVDIEIEPEELARKLTMAGLEVESIERWEPPFSNVVVAQIENIKAHPQADNLSICDVTDGINSYSIVCGAPNIKIGDFVPLAKTGALLPGVLIKEAKIRGELSSGMLCSEAELGISSDVSGVMILFRQVVEQGPVGNVFPLSAEVDKLLSLGDDLGKALDLQDTIFNISITPNRPDCLSVIGLAREIAALTDKKLKLPEVNVQETDEAVEHLTSVAIADPELCSRYAARIIKKLIIKSSPLWMRLRLERAGMRAINNIVDATNFVMLEMGQPLHAFDYLKLAEGRIVVRRSAAGEVFTTLDGKDRELKPDMILICDGEKPVALGGIMGGSNSEVSENTKTILLESAYFDPASIRTSAKWLGMSSDASFRFERGIDPEGVIRAQNRAAQLIAKLGAGVICRGKIDCHPRPITTVEDIVLRGRRVRALAGTEIKNEDILHALSSLEMRIKKDESNEDAYLVTPPTFRIDIDREIDLIEEIIRIRGYDTIPTTLPVISLMPLHKETRVILEEKIKGILTGNGYSEIISYSFISPQWNQRLGFEEGDERTRLVVIKNPLAEDQSVMRTTLLCGLLEAMKRNVHLSSFDLKLFEVGRVFFSRGTGNLPCERNHLACLVTGMQDDALCHSKRPVDYYDLKGCAESIFAELRIGSHRFIAGTREPFLHPGKSSTIMVGERQVGYLGELRTNTLEFINFKGKAYVMEINLDVLNDDFPPSLRYREISHFPAITRDAALLVSKTINAENILSIVREIDEVLLEKVHIFDIYEGQGIPESLRSLGLRFTYRSPEKTLTDDEIASVHIRIVERVILLTGASLRG